MQRISIASASLAALLLAGCANPGSPSPPSLNLPQTVKNLRAERWGPTVRLYWTVPERTTDGLLLTGATPKNAFSPRARSHSGALAAELCRVEAKTCKPLARITVLPNEEASYTDQLPDTLQSGTPSVVEYHVRILNAAGRNAGSSNAALVPSGETPAPITHLTVRPVRQGAELQWTPADHPQQAEEVDISREPIATKPLPAKSKQPKNIALRIPATPDPGGTIDNGIKRDETYSYTAVRMRQVTVGGHNFEVRGTPATIVSGSLASNFPPNAPRGLEAVATPASATHKAAIDLSWDPNQESDLAGYLIYRADSTSPADWVRVSAERVVTAAFHDESVTANHTYLYRVTAVSSAGKESAPSTTARETLPGVE